jgi:hypothetical protein
MVDRANFGFWILDFGLFFGSSSVACGRSKSKIQNLKSKIISYLYRFLTLRSIGVIKQ